MKRFAFRPPQLMSLAGCLLLAASLLGQVPADQPAPAMAESTAEPTETGQSEQEESGEAEAAGAETDDGERPDGQEREGESETRELTPKERAKLEELERKREERKAKRRAKKAKQAAKRAEKRAARQAKHQERLAEVLAKGYEALESGDLDKARSAFETYGELDGGKSFTGEMGLARTELTGQNSALAVEHALEAAKATAKAAEKAEALSFAAEATLAARPRDDSTGEPLPGTEIFYHNALRYHMQALADDLEGAAEARRALEEAFPSVDDERIGRFYERFLESSESAPRRHARRLAATYEALLSGRIDGPLAVAGGIRPPQKLSGERPPYPQEPTDDSIRQRLVASFIVARDGTVSEVRVLNGSDRWRDSMAESVLREWIFDPARLPNGTPVEVHWVMALNADTTPLEEPTEEEVGENEHAEGASAESEEIGQPLPDEPGGEDDQ